MTTYNVIGRAAVPTPQGVMVKVRPNDLVRSMSGSKGAVWRVVQVHEPENPRVMPVLDLVSLNTGRSDQRRAGWLHIVVPESVD